MHRAVITALALLFSAGLAGPGFAGGAFSGPSAPPGGTMSTPKMMVGKTSVARAPAPGPVGPLHRPMPPNVPVHHVNPRPYHHHAIGFGGGYSYPLAREPEVRQPVYADPPLRRRDRRAAFYAAAGGPAYGSWRAARAAPRPYAPPVIYIIGEPSRRHMRGPVNMVHGVSAPRRLDTDPRVIFLNERHGGKHAARSVKGVE
jgi:hypothetical protein